MAALANATRRPGRRDSDALPWLIRARDPPGVDDMVLLTNAQVAGITTNLKQRLEADLIYTFIGQVLVVVNPYVATTGHHHRPPPSRATACDYE